MNVGMRKIMKRARKEGKGREGRNEGRKQRQPTYREFLSNVENKNIRENNT